MIVMTPLAGHEDRLRLLSVIAQVQPESFAIESA